MKLFASKRIHGPVLLIVTSPEQSQLALAIRIKVEYSSHIVKY